VSGLAVYPLHQYHEGRLGVSAGRLHASLPAGDGISIDPQVGIYMIEAIGKRLAGETQAFAQRANLLAVHQRKMLG
jgi:hypothetical protein